MSDDDEVTYQVRQETNAVKESSPQGVHAEVPAKNRQWWCGCGVLWMWQTTQMQ